MVRNSGVDTFSDDFDSTSYQVDTKYKNEEGKFHECENGKVEGSD